MDVLAKRQAAFTSNVSMADICALDAAAVRRVAGPVVIPTGQRIFDASVLRELDRDYSNKDQVVHGADRVVRNSDSVSDKYQATAMHVSRHFSRNLGSYIAGTGYDQFAEGTHSSSVTEYEMLRSAFAQGRCRGQLEASSRPPSQALVAKAFQGGMQKTFEEAEQLACLGKYKWLTVARDCDEASLRVLLSRCQHAMYLRSLLELIGASKVLTLMILKRYLAI